MLYAATTLWLLIAVFTAWSIHRSWCALVPPKVVNSLLLPGTLVDGVGHIVGLLLTGGTVNSTTLMRDDRSDDEAPSRIPVIGPIVVAMLPVIACGACIYLAARFLGSDLVARMSDTTLPQTLPTTLGAFWDLLRHGITLVESLTYVVRTSDPRQGSFWFFGYLMVCLTVRVGPLPGTIRGATGAVLVLGPLATLIGTSTEVGRAALERGWPMLSFSMAVLFFLMLVTLIVRGGVGFVRLLVRSE
jgi:hypothetical protein